MIEILFAPKYLDIKNLIVKDHKFFRLNMIKVFSRFAMANLLRSLSLLGVP